MKKLLVVISFFTLFMVAHATVKEVAIEYLTAEQVSPGNDGIFGEVNPEQWRLYGGKELQTVNGLNLRDFHARWQDYATGRLTTQDPLAEKYHALSPYIYCAKKIDSNYGNQEERAVILGEESETAKKLGKIFPNELTRKDQSGTIYPVESPTSDEVNGYIVTPNIYNHE